MSLRPLLSALTDVADGATLARDGGAAFVSASLRPYVLAALADEDGERAALVVAGDDRQARDRGLDYEIVPGVTSLFAAAAALEIELTVAPGSSQPLILSQGRGDPVGVRELARHGGTLALFMVAERAEELQRELIAGGYEPSCTCAVAHRVSWPDDEVVLTCRLDELAATVAERELDRHTIIIVGPALDADGPGVSAPS